MRGETFLHGGGSTKPEPGRRPFVRLAIFAELELDRLHATGPVLVDPTIDGDAVLIALELLNRAALERALPLLAGPGGVVGYGRN